MEGGRGCGGRWGARAESGCDVVGSGSGYGRWGTEGGAGGGEGRGGGWTGERYGDGGGGLGARGCGGRGGWHENGVVDGGDGDGGGAAELEAHERLSLRFSRFRELNLRV